MRPVPAIALAAIAVLSATVALNAQQMPAEPPGKPDVALITGGSYTVDPGHTQVMFTYDHMGFTKNMGVISGPSSGSLTLDPKAAGNASVTVTFPVANIRTGVSELDEHLMKPNFFDAEKFPAATFTSTSVVVDGEKAAITGNLTIHGITKEVTLDTQFIGAGVVPMNNKENVGFSAQGTIKRSDFGMGFGVPLVSDTIELKIVAAFEK